MLDWLQLVCNHLHVHSLKGFRVAILLALTLAALYSFLPLGATFILEGDEGFELNKAFLYSKGFQLYGQIWSDQPPLWTVMLGSLFKITGPSILAARLLAAGFGILMFVTFYELIRLRLNDWTAAIATFILVSSPGTLRFSASVIQEVPTFAMVLMSALLLFRWGGRSHWTWLVISGMLMGAALEIKYTAALGIPAMCLEIILLLQPLGHQHWMISALKKCACWSAAAAVTFALFNHALGKGSYQSVWHAQSVSIAPPGMARPEDFHFTQDLFVNHSECIAAAIAGIVIMICNRQWRILAFPLVLLVTALAVHTWHRPCWLEYYLHLAIPLAWLAGYAIVKIGNYMFNEISAGQWKLNVKATWVGIILCAAIALAFSRSLDRSTDTMNDLQSLPKTSSDPILEKMQKYAPRTHWVYCQEGIYAFHAKLLTPPELAVVTLKRYWSGDITTKDVIKVCERYNPEQLLLNTNIGVDDWKEFLDGKYTCTLKKDNYMLYISNNLN